MTDAVKIDKENPVQKHGAWIVAGIFLVVLIVYSIRFPVPFNGSQEVWGQFGDFVGGLINPIIGFFTILLLSISLRQNQKALEQANAALTQSHAELELTRKSIDDARLLQAATENALNEQIVIAGHARDINNATALYREMVMHHASVEGDFQQAVRIKGVDDHHSKLLQDKLSELGAKKYNLRIILDSELERLVTLHVPEGQRLRL